MKFFEYAEPASLEEATELLQQCAGAASLMAGGTDLMVMMKEHVRTPSHVVNIKKIQGLDDFRFNAEDGLHIGALVTTRQIETSAVTRRHYASLAKACTDFASIQVRNRATLVGNVCHASPSADSLPALIADRALVHIHGAHGKRQCRLEEFIKGPGRTTLGTDELVTHIEIPAPAVRTGKVYIKHGRRSQMELATVGVAVTLTLDAQGCIKAASIILAAVGPTPIRASAAEALLQGRSPDQALIAAASQSAATAATPISDVRASAEYRSDMVDVLTARALALAIKEAKQ
ncbi:xanthine dehydrogenase family protein subunit M [Comamonas sp.]|uniref:FAD binding domain-containing protein n=1 Tax=Comamonas sp. TaxID=34028 RepID=UPI0012C8B815|nr:xanthine dehydrogenase family protein subunit M [Comamonas sp.]MPS92510.1 xanthine dehydrogenase family protein subunit M [Comamonas sp.]